MAVPAHDTRDFEFAVLYELPIVAVVDPGEAADIDRQAVLAGSACYSQTGTACNSGSYDGLETDRFHAQIPHDLHPPGLRQAAVHSKLRASPLSRQRLWR